MMMLVRPWWVLGATLACAACMSEKPQLVASNCDDPAGCVTQEALHIDAVDILFVIDNSNSIAPANAALKAQLPRMLNAIVTGADGDMSFPPATSVHVAVTTTDMGIGPYGRIGPDGRPVGCTEKGDDGVFVHPAEVGVTCDVSYPGYLAYEGAGAPLATVDTIGCLPLVFADNTMSGCGYEQPLEAGLKAVWPGAKPDLAFTSGHGHGNDENSGFLRNDSLLVVVIVTDEDDCSTADQSIFAQERQADQPGNLGCFLNRDKLYDPQRYVEHFKGLRPRNDNVVFAVIGGVPPELVSDDYRGDFDFTVPAQADAYFDAVLADARMLQVADPMPETGWTGRETLAPSCSSTTVTAPTGSDRYLTAQPPRRLVEVARGFGAQGVLGSICANDFGSTTGHIIRAVGERLTAVAAH